MRLLRDGQNSDDSFKPAFGSLELQDGTNKLDKRRKTGEVVFYLLLRLE
jgi:hypothetical protein